MLLRVLSTAASLTVALAAVAIIDCSSAAFRFLGGDPLGVCGAIASPGSGSGLWLGIALSLFAAIALVATWVPAARPGARRRRLQPENSLSKNLDRLSDVGIPEITEDPEESEVNVKRLRRRLETVEASLASGATPTREVTQQWMSLLREANDLHNRDELTTEDFKEINTRLVGLFAGPGEEAEEMAASG